MSIKPYHRFTHNADTYVINIEEVKAFKIDENVSVELDAISLDSDLLLTPAIEKELKKLNLVVLKHQRKKKVVASKPNATPIRNIALFVTQNCNLSCVYCYGHEGSYGSSGHMTIATAQRSVDWLIEQSGDVKKLGIAFFGGEPFLNFSLMKDVVAYARERSAESGKDFEFSVTTNASLLDEKKIAFMKENKVMPLVSFDGAEEVQDIQRPFKGGQGSYKRIIPKISQLLQSFPNATARATLIGTATPAEVTAALHEIGFISTHIAIASPSLFDSESKRKEDDRDSQNMILMMESDADKLLENIKQRNTEYLKKQKANGVLVSRLEEFINNQKKFFGCGAGRSYVGVSNAGDVFLCHRFVGTDDYQLANVFGGIIKRDEYHKSPINTVNECQKCFARYSCGGGCYHENIGATGAINEPSSSYCHMMRRSVELIAYISCHLSEDDKNYMIKYNIITKKPCPFDFPE